MSEFSKSSATPASALIVAKTDGTIKEWNTMAEDMFGWKYEEVTGRHLTSNFLPDHVWQNHILSDMLNRSSERIYSQRIEAQCNRIDGESIPVELIIVPSNIGGHDLLNIFAIDVDKRSKTERVLLVINELVRKLIGKTSLEDIAGMISETVIDHIGVQNCSIYILDDETGKLRLITAAGESDLSGKDNSQIMNSNIDSGEQVFPDNFFLSEEYIVHDHEQISELIVPIIDNSNVVGVIHCQQDTKGFFTQYHIDTFTNIAGLSASQIAIALEKKRRVQAENSLRESEERWQHLVENQPDAVQLTKDGRITYLNPAGVRLFEAKNMQEMKDFDLYGFVSEDIKKELLVQHQLLMRYGIADPLEYPIKTLKGNERYVEANSTTIIIDGETVVQTILRDITEKKKAERELKNLSSLLRTLIDNINSGILMEAPDRTVMYTNQMFCDLFGNVFTPDDIIGQDCAAMIRPASLMFSDPEYFQEKTNAVFSKSEPSLNEIWTGADGRVFERDFIPIRYESKYIGSAWQYRDVTDAKMAEDKLKDALQTERNYNELNKNLISMVSHEFRTPLTSITSTAELLLKYTDKFSGNELTKRVERIYGSAIKMDALIQDVLTIGKLESENTSIELQEFNLRNLINELIQSLNLTILKDREVIVNAESASDILYLDLNLMELILRNLLENAGKYSFAPDKIIVNFTITHSHLTLQCLDFGIGIPEKDREIVFESFVRGTNIKDIKGTGLGLSIVKKAVERMRGTIELESGQPQGTSVTINIPLVRNN